jgi:hypothetical protein
VARLSLTPFVLSPDDLNRRRGLLAAHNVSSAESALLHAVSYSTNNQPAYLPGYAQGERYTLDAPVSEAESQDALGACLAKGWLRIIDEADLAAIRDELSRDGVFGPVLGLPPVGGVDFTPDGAALWLRLVRGLSNDVSPYWFLRGGRGRRELYCRDYDAALRHARRLSSPPYEAVVSEPEEIGPWRVQWWRRFEWGYRLDVDSPYQGDTFWRREKPASPPFALQERLGQALMRRGVTWGDWRLLSSIESHQIRRPELFPSLDEGMRKGWVQVLDQHSLGRIHALLAADPTELQFRHFLPRPGLVDFTPAGAALYQSVGAEAHWPDWDADLYVGRVRSWTEHSYCETEAGLHARYSERRIGAATVLSARVERLGPWCAFWWRRFAGGYRLDAEFASAGSLQ